VLYFFLFLLGLCSGSFISCLVYRVNHDLPFFKGRSVCDSCQKQLRWFDNLPLVSFLLLRGRCRFCHSPISWQYPLVELAVGFLTVYFIYFQFGIWNLLLSYSLIAIFLSDLNYSTIPDHFLYPAFIFALISQLPHFLFINLAVGFGTAAFFWGLNRLTKGRGMAMGDVKLAGLMGFLLGFPLILVALYFAFLTGAVVGVILILLGKKKFGEQIPFGPFLVVGTFVAWWWGGEIWLRIIRLLL